MKRFLILLVAFGILLACTPEENNSNGNDNPVDKTVHVTGISLDRPTASIKEDEYFTLVATVTPDNATNKNVTWSSSSEAVATVDNNGKVTGIKAGSATITATAEDGEMKATCALSVEANLAPSVTVEANHISAISAVLAGKANLGSTVAADLKVGFHYSKSAGILPSNSTTIEATDADANYNYTASITGLEPDTKYYFRSFILQNGQYTYGETISFTTKDVASMLETKDASDIEATKASLNAKLDLTDVQYNSLDYGFLWGTSESALNSDFKCTEIKDNVIAAALTSLSHKTQYWYKAYVKLDSQTFYGEVKTFTTDVVPVESVSLDKTEHIFNTIGNTLTLNATVLPSDATDKSVEWSSDNEAAATVDQNGIVQAIGNGTASITVTTKDHDKKAACTITVAQHVTSIALNRASISLATGADETIMVTSILPDNANDKTYMWSSSYDSIATVDQNGKITARAKGSTVIKATANDGSGVFASCEVKVKNPCPVGAVNLGLKVDWATCNLDQSGFVSSPVAWGDYYAWGEVFSKASYTWGTYRYRQSGNSVYNIIFTKYNTSTAYGTVDNKTILDAEDDIAHEKLGGTWRIPTEEEWAELRENCTWKWTNNYNSTGFSGIIVTSNVIGYTDKFIFLPASGYKDDTGSNDVGSSGHYWSSSLRADVPYTAGRVFFNWYYFIGNNKERYFGQSIRPVSD